MTGGAPVNDHIKKWMFECVGTCVDGYGTTETGGISSNSQISPGVQVQLIDCPEMNYFTSDLPYPRGEIVTHTKRMTPGYYNDPEKNKESFIMLNGKQYFRTGDIGRLVNGNIEVIDRKKSMFKLSQGVFIAPEKLETAYISCDYISQIFVYGDRMASCVSAVIVPTNKILKTLIPQSNEESFNILLENENYMKEAEKLLKSELKKIAKEKKLETWEVPQIILVEVTPFTVWNGLLTTIGKLARANLINHYRPIFEELFKARKALLENNLAQNASEEINTKEVISRSDGLCQGVCLLIEKVLEIPSSEFTANDSLLDLGVDSLALARLSSAIKKQFGSNIPLPALVKIPNLMLLQTAIFCGLQAIQSELTSDAPTNSDEWKNEVENIWKLIDPENQLQQLHSPNLENKTKILGIPGDILLTGVSGYLGIFLLEKLLETPEFKARKIYLIIRAKDNSEALNRLKETAANYEVNLENELERIIVFSGDLGLAQFGVKEQEYQELLEKVTIIYHNAAIVNAVLPYSFHKPANVLGTAEIIKFSLRQTNEVAFKYLNYISTVGCVCGVKEETLDIPADRLSVVGGYPQSKWVAEQLIKKISEKGYPVNIFRPSTIFMNSKTGKYNPKDSAINLIKGIVKEKIYCEIDMEETGSFFPGEFNFVPVEWVANCIVSVSLSKNRSFIFHVINEKATPFQRIIDAIRSEVNLEKVRGDQMKQIVNVVEEDHPWFIYKSIIANAGYATKINIPFRNNLMDALPFLTHNDPLITDNLLHYFVSQIKIQ